MIVEENDAFKFKTNETLHHHLIKIPENTRARRFPGDRECYQFNLSYDAMSLFFNKWEVVLRNCQKSSLDEISNDEDINELVHIVKFISKLLILSPELIEDFITDAEDSNDVFENVKCIIDKLMRSLDILQLINKNDEFDTALAIILDCIRVLIENKFKDEVATILVEFNQSSESSIHYNKGHGSYMMPRNGFFEKFLRDVELPTGKRLVSKAFVKL